MGAATFHASRGLAVLAIDLQWDFVEGGALEVPGADSGYRRQVLASLQQLHKAGCLLLASRDDHPKAHDSFASSHPGKKPFEIVRNSLGEPKTLWPDHCVKGSRGSELVVDPDFFVHVFDKGQTIHSEGFSAFGEEGGPESGLESVLRAHQISTLVIFGLAIEYCVKRTCLDARRRGYQVIFIEGLSRGLSLPGIAESLSVMNAAGVMCVPELLESGLVGTSTDPVRGPLRRIVESSDRAECSHQRENLKIQRD